MTYSDPQSAPASPHPKGQPSLVASGVSSGLVAPFLAFSMGRRIALLALVPFTLSIVFVVAGLVLGFTHGVDWVYGRVDVALALLLDAGWLRTMISTVVAWPLGLVLSAAAGYQVGFLLSLPLLDRLAQAVERREGWVPEGPGLGVTASMMAVCVYMVAWLCGGVVFALLALLPVVGVVFIGLGWLWSSLCLALDALDPSLCRAGLTMRQRLGLVLRHPLPVLSFGGLASVWIMVPGSYPGIVVGGARLAARLLRSEAKGPNVE